RQQILRHVVRRRNGEYRHGLEQIRKEGVLRLPVDGHGPELTDHIPHDRYKQHTIEVVVDRLVVKPGIETRLADSIEPALRMGKGILGVLYEPPAADGSGEREPRELLFSERFACIECGISMEEIAPRNFS